MRALVVGLCLCVVAACGPPKDTSGAKLELADAKLIVVQDDNQTHVLKLAADGAVTFDQEPLLRLETNGHILVDGKRIARVERDGSISVKSVRTNAVVKDDGTFVLDGVEELVIAEDGRVSGPLVDTIDHPKVKLAGSSFLYAGPPGARRATMVGFAAVLTNLPAAAAP